MATEILWALSGRQFGVCPVTVRPCIGGDCPERWPWGYKDIVRGCIRRCACNRRTELGLPGPVHEITAVTVDGVALPGSAYRVENGRWLIRQDGETWPLTQDVAAAAGEVGTWSVDYLRGTPVPASGNYAAGELAVEIAKACVGDAKCKLPSRAQSLSRQGVEITLLDPLEFIDDGRTGLPLVDQWIASVNPTRQTSRSRVYSPDLPRFR